MGNNVNNWFDRSFKRSFKSNKRWPIIIRFEGKSGSEYFVCNDTSEIEQVALYQLWFRWHSGCYFDHDNQNEQVKLENANVISALNNRNGRLAYAILMRRADYEYENVTIESVSIIDLPEEGNLIEQEPKDKYLL